MFTSVLRKQLNICHVLSYTYAAASTIQIKIHTIVHDSIHYEPHIKLFLNYSSDCFAQVSSTATSFRHE